MLPLRRYSFAVAVTPFIIGIRIAIIITIMIIGIMLLNIPEKGSVAVCDG